MDLLLLLFSVVSLLMAGARGCQLEVDRKYGGTFADCREMNLSSIPTNLPANTTSLDLSRNKIEALQVTRNNTFWSLKYLDVSYNILSALESGAFESFNSLEELFMNNNMLALDNRSYPDDVFKPLQNLLKLHLHNNDQRDDGAYPEEAIGNLEMIEELKIDTFRKTHFGVGFSKLFNLKQLILGFGGCKLEYLQNGTFTNLKNVSLILIDFNHCPIVNLEKGSFLPLTNLKYLYLSNAGHLEPTTAVLGMYGLQGRNLSSIEMNNIFAVVDFRDEKLDKRILSNDVMVYLKEVCVEKFSMVDNELLWIGSDILKKSVFSKCIKYIDWSLNDLYGDITYVFILSLASNLVHLNLSSHGRGRGGNLFHSVFQHTPTKGLTIPDKLEVLNLDGVVFGRGIVLEVIFHVFNATSLRYLSFANNRLRNIHSRITGLENLTEFDLSGNDCSGMNPTLYEDFPNLESLSMINVKFEENYLLTYGKQIFQPMRKMKKINLDLNDLRFLDDNIFSSNQMEEITMSHNRFTSIPFDLKTTPHLQYLDLSFNSFAVLSDTEMGNLDDLSSTNNLTLNLKGNLLSCGCHSLDFIMWMYTTNVRVIFVSSYICQMSDGSIANTSYIRNHYEEIWMSCNGRMSLSVTTALLFLFLLVMVVLYVTMRKKTLLANILFRFFGYGPIPRTLKRSDFLNDAYIGYSDADYQYICHTVRDHLENRHGLKLFIRDRDTIPGGQIADDIISGIDCSWRTVLFLTTAFLDDQWCRFTINRVVYSSARMPTGHILLVLLDDVRMGGIDPALLNVVEEKNIFFVERYRGDHDRLLKDISRSIKENITT